MDPTAPQTLADFGWFGAGLLVLTALTIAINAYAGTRLGAFPLWALVRAVLQLGVVALLLRGILSVPWTVVGFLLLMLSTASVTALNRLRGQWRGAHAAIVGVVAGASVTLVLVFALHLVELEVRYLVAVAGIVIGNTMTAATLAGRNFRRAAHARASEVEGWLALGATPARAYAEIGQEAARESLLPSLDQTKSTGLVTLPGAFVGALFGGASPVVAAQFQLVVLAGIGLAMSITAVVVVRTLGRSPYVVVATATS